jgi:hypothetical protein
MIYKAMHFLGVQQNFQASASKKQTPAKIATIDMIPKGNGYLANFFVGTDAQKITLKLTQEVDSDILVPHRSCQIGANKHCPFEKRYDPRSSAPTIVNPVAKFAANQLLPDEPTYERGAYLY